MSTVLRLKIVLVAVGLLVFAWGLRSDVTIVRWVGIAMVFVAWMLRFWRGRAGGVPEERGPA